MKAINMIEIEQYAAEPLENEAEGYDLIGCYRVTFLKEWVGKWTLISPKFNGKISKSEENIISSYCQWIDAEFKGGDDENYRRFLTTGGSLTEGKRVILEIDGESKAVVCFSSPLEGNLNIGIYLYRRAKNLVSAS